MCNNNVNAQYNFDLKSYIVILGSGESGIGCVLLANKMGYKNIFLSDKNIITSKYLNILKKLNVKYEMNYHNMNKILCADLIIKSPGISNTSNIIIAIKQKNIKIISEIEFAFNCRKNIKIIGITGTNGKTTTSILIYKLLQYAGYKTCLAGNIGNSFAKVIATTNSNDYDYYILELSSFQLEYIYNFKTYIAIITNISSDHMDRYTNINQYINAKLNIIKNHSSNNYLIYNHDNIINNIINSRNDNFYKLSFSIKNKILKGAYYKNKIIVSIINNRHIYIDKKYLKLKGEHNIYNYMSALIVSNILNIDINTIIECFSKIEFIKHRIEYFMRYNNITFINDSKSTNITCVYHALKCVNKPIIWITGGIDKGNDYNIIKQLIINKVVKIICIKPNKNIYNYFFKICEIINVMSMKEAVRIAISISYNKCNVLLSPGCSSLNSFKSYKHRGNCFKLNVQKYINSYVKNYQRR